MPNAQIGLDELSAIRMPQILFVQLQDFGGFETYPVTKMFAHRLKADVMLATDPWVIVVAFFW